MKNFMPDQNTGGGDYTSGSDDDELIQVDGVIVEMLFPPPALTLDSGSDVDDTAAIAMDNSVPEAPDTWNLSDSEDEEEKDATAEQVFEIEPSVETTRDQPPDIEVGAEVIDVKFHPSTNVVAAATLDAEVVCYRYSTDKCEELHSSEHHDSALRSIMFSKSGDTLISASKDETVAVLDTKTWKIKKHYLKAHDSPVYSLCSINENLFASGDDDGTVKVWDMRSQRCIFSFKCGEETVSSIIVDDSGKTLVVSVNDGSIAAFNLIKRKLIVQSEMYDHPLSCLSIVRNGTRLVVGSENGDLRLFKWGDFGYHIDTITEQPQQINCMEAVGDNRVITGCDDGYIRAINLYPHRYVGVVGRHLQYGVEGISISCDQRYLASCCQDDVVHFWDLQHLYNTETDERKKSVKIRDMRNNLGSSRERNPTEFFADMSQDVSPDDDYVGPVDKPANIE